MHKPRVLIVGAGAGGLVTGYHLSLSGAEVTFYVRPARMASLQSPQQLYCYDDCQLKIFAGYSLICDMAAVRNSAFDYVLVTLDGHAAFAAEGAALLRELGQAVAATAAVIVNLGVGVNLRAHYRASTGLPEARIVSGTFNLLSHFVADARLPLHAPTDAAALAQARVGYRHLNGKDGLVIDNVSEHARTFAALYGASGVSGCAVVSPVMVDMMYNLLFPLFAVFELAGWPDTPAMLGQHRSLWRLGCAAVREIAAQPAFGWQGQLARLLLRPWLCGRLWTTLDRNCLPLDFKGFNRLHHGGKVVAQDTDILRTNLQQGQARGLQMPHLAQLLTRLDAYRRG
jgi:hypothetical protein